jgi:hypothetical protein
LISSETALGDFLGAFSGVSEVVSFDENRDRLTFKDATGETLQARFVTEGNDLKLQGLKTQCAVCFGEVDQDCRACDGEGWV